MNIGETMTAQFSEGCSVEVVEEQLNNNTIFNLNQVFIHGQNLSKRSLAGISSSILREDVP